jgi:hypothetical protein
MEAIAGVIGEPKMGLDDEKLQWLLALDGTTTNRPGRRQAAASWLLLLCSDGMPRRSSALVDASCTFFLPFNGLAMARMLVFVLLLPPALL